MPRPKRTKVAPSAPAPRLRQAAKSAQISISAAPVHKLQRENVYDISDPEDGTVTSVRRVRRSIGKGKATATRGRTATRAEDENLPEAGEVEATGRAENVVEDYHMGGALGDDLDLDLDLSNDSIELSRRDDNVNTPAIESSRMSLANFRRRPRQPSILGRATARGRSSSVESNLAQDNGLMSVGRKNTSAIRGRQRAPSMSRFNIASSSAALEMERGATPAHAGSVLNLGKFKRRQREPSILGTAQKKRDERAASDFELDDEEDFEPDGESTPLNFERTRASAINSTPVASSSSSKKRKRGEMNAAVQVPQSSENAHSPTAPQSSEQIPMTLSSDHEDDDRELNSDSSEAEDLDEDNVLPIQSIEQARNTSMTPDIQSETMAPPRSSSSQPSSPHSPALPAPRMARPAPSRGRQLRGRTPPPRTQDSPISSPPSLTHSPNRVGTVAKKGKKPLPPPSTFSTAQLQALMPQRRRRAARRAGRNGDPFDVPSSDGEAEIDTSGLASDDDELSHIQVRARPRRPNTQAAKPKTVAKAKLTVQASTSASKRTYGTRQTLVTTTSDKENEAAEEEEVDPDDSLAPIQDNTDSPENSQELEARVGKELKMAARKFAEVDRWELDFEDVSASSESFRERDAR